MTITTAILWLARYPISQLRATTRTLCKSIDIYRVCSLETANYSTVVSSAMEADLSEGLESVTEGKASVYYKKGDVFYNEVQALNRDLTVLVMRSYAEQRKSMWEAKGKQMDIEAAPFPGISVMEALSATGLRAIRFAKEVPHVKSVMANDMSPTAVEEISRNIRLNNVEDIVKANCQDAIAALACRSHQFDVVDLDPYGSPVAFLDASMIAIRDNGLLGVTATDSQVFCGAAPPQCYAKYNSYPVHPARYIHENGLRLLIRSVGDAAARHGKIAKPILSLSIDYYLRVFFSVENRKKELHHRPVQTAMLHTCYGCGYYLPIPIAQEILRDKLTRGQKEFLNREKAREAESRKRKHGEAASSDAIAEPQVLSKIHNNVVPVSVSSHCSYCKTPLHVAGPFYWGRLHDSDLLARVSALLEESDQAEFPSYSRLKGMLHALSEEDLDSPLYYRLSDFGSLFRGPVMPRQVMLSALRRLGHRVSGTHCQADCFKSTASHVEVLAVFRAWLLQSSWKAGSKLKVNSPGWRIWQQDLPHPWSDDVLRTMDLSIDEEDEIGKGKPVRFVAKPPNWGPGTRAKRN